ncbi:MAG TPA: GAF and ANTAR domain-containing protein [Acidimicrobiales bacterium]|nr:GAF and ANTAR domain-containing protein [Acidimicrobiales bacterium]
MTSEQGSTDWVGDACVALADALAAGFDLEADLRDLIGYTARLAGTADVGVFITDRGGPLRAVGGDTAARPLELLELDQRQGPCVDCATNGEPVVNRRLEDAADRWPDLAAAGLAAGFRLVSALPLRHGGVVFGAVNLFQRDAGDLPEREVRLAQSLADAAAVGIAHHRAHLASAERGDQLQQALDERVLVEQAKGMLAEQLGIGTAEAFDILRRRARASQQRVADLAARVVAREIAARDLTGV